MPHLRRDARRGAIPGGGLVALLLSLAGCAQPGAAPAQGAGPEAPTAAKTEVDALADLPPDLRALAREVERARGLRFRRPVRIIAVDDDEMERHLDEGKLEPAPDAADPEALWSFGLLSQRPPPSWLLSLLPRSRRKHRDILAFYVHSTRLVYARMQLMDDPGLLAHELAHALVHDVFSLSFRVPTDDQQLAVRALSEGDATVTAALVVQARKGGSEAAALRKASGWDETSMDHVSDASGLASSLPLYRERELVPYRTGAKFVAEVVMARGMSGLNEVWAHPPRGTFEVFHPDLYARGVPLPSIGDAPLPAGCRAGAEGAMGELRTRAFLRVKHPRAQALAGADGLLADRYRLLSGCGDAPGFVWQTSWKDGESAARFERLAGELVGCREQGCLKGAGSVVRSKNDVVVIRGLSDPEAGKLALAAIAPAKGPAEPRLGGASLAPPPEESHLVEHSSGKPCTIAASGAVVTPPQGLALVAGQELTCSMASESIHLTFNSLVSATPYSNELLAGLRSTLPRAFAATHSRVQMRERRRATPLGPAASFDFELTEPHHMEVLVLPICGGSRSLTLYLYSVNEEGRVALEEVVASLRPRSVGLDASCSDPTDE